MQKRVQSRCSNCIDVKVFQLGCLSAGYLQLGAWTAYWLNDRRAISRKKLLRRGRERSKDEMKEMHLLSIRIWLRGAVDRQGGAVVRFARSVVIIILEMLFG